MKKILVAIALAVATGLAAPGAAQASATCSGSGYGLLGSHNSNGNFLNDFPSVSCSGGTSTNGWDVTFSPEYSDNGGSTWHFFTTSANNQLQAKMPTGACSPAPGYAWGRNVTIDEAFAGIGCDVGEDATDAEKPQPAQNPCAAGRIYRQTVLFESSGGQFIKSSVGVTGSC